MLTLISAASRVTLVNHSPFDRGSFGGPDQGDSRYDHLAAVHVRYRSRDVLRRRIAGLSGGERSYGRSILYDEATGQPMTNFGQDVVCVPAITALPRPPVSSRSLSMTLLLEMAHARSTPRLSWASGWSCGGNDPDGVNVQGFVVNSHTSPFDLSVFGFEPEVLRASEYHAKKPSRDRVMLTLPKQRERHSPRNTRFHTSANA